MIKTTLPLKPLFLSYKKNKDTFFVTEENLYDFSGEGEFLVLFVEKQDIDTLHLLQTISDSIGVKKNEIGYCGLKDKAGTTRQYINLPKTYESKINSFKHPNIKILSSTYHNNKFRIGHLKGNNFEILLDKCPPELEKNVEVIQKYGFANYFGFQRFGRDNDNYLIGKKIIEKKIKSRDKRKNKFFISAYQSYLFNQWLEDRIDFSLNYKMLDISDKLKQTIEKQPHFFKLLEGEIFLHYPFGKLFQSEEISCEAQRFSEKDICPTGLLSGHKAMKSSLFAREFEEKIDIIDTKGVLGQRRFAWIFPDKMSLVKENNKTKLSFYLPKGCYATTLLEQIGINIE